MAVGMVPVTSVACPPWCDRSQRSHLSRLESDGGMPLHFSEGVEGDGWEVYVAATTYCDGSEPSATEDAPAVFFAEGVPPRLAPEEARRLAEALLALAEVAEGKARTEEGS